MHWNYRIIETIDLDDRPLLTIHEVFYDDKNRIEGWSSEGAIPTGNTLEELKQDLTYMRQALDKLILVEQDNKLIERHGTG